MSSLIALQHSDVVTPLSNIFSFLLPEDQQSARGVCKHWQSMGRPIIPPVENGYGDFLLFDRTGKDVDRDTFKKAYSLVLNKYLPQVHQKPVENRLKEVNVCLGKIDPKLRAVFVARAVYELYYILATAKEECDLVSKAFFGCNNGDRSILCWHNFIFNPFWTKAGQLPPEAVELAYRLNQFIIKEGRITNKGLTEAQFKQTARGIVKRLFEMSKDCREKMKQGTPGKTCYGKNSNIAKFLGEKPMLIQQMLERSGLMPEPAFLDRAISLECSKEAENAFVLYRGSTRRDEPLFVEVSGKNYPYCLSYGLSLFAGYHHDPKACAAVRMFYDEPGWIYPPVLSYALTIPFKDHWQDAYSLPKVNTVCGLNAFAERFHGRAQCVNPENSCYIEGYLDILDEEAVEELISPLSEEELRKKQDVYQSKRIVFIQKPT